MVCQCSVSGKVAYWHFKSENKHCGRRGRTPARHPVFEGDKDQMFVAEEYLKFNEIKFFKITIVY